MNTYRATLVDDVALDDAVLELEVCGALDIEQEKDGRSVKFTADVNDIPSIEALSTVKDVFVIGDGESGFSPLTRGFNMDSGSR